MAPTERRCSYEFDLDEWCDVHDSDADAVESRRHAVRDGWQCPHPVHEDEDRCLFHLSPAERRERGIDETAVRDAMLAALDADPPRKQFVGATFDSLDLTHRRLQGTDNEPIDLRHAEIRGAVLLEGTTVGAALWLQHADVGDFVVDNATFHAVSYFNHAVFRGDVRISERVDDRLKFDGARFEGTVELNPATFERGVWFNDCVFDADVQFYADFENEAQFTGATFNGEVDVFADFNADFYFEDATFGAPVSFFGVFDGTMWASNVTFAAAVEIHGRFYGEVMLDGATFGGDVSFAQLDSEVSASRFYEFVNLADATFRGEADFESVDFQGDADFHGATFADVASFDGAYFRGRANFDGVVCAGPLSFRSAEFDEWVQFRLRCRDDRPVIDLSESVLDAGILDISSDFSVVYDLTRATVGAVELRGPDDENLLDRLRVYETDFDGFDFSRHRAALARSGWVIHEVVGNGGASGDGAGKGDVNTGDADSGGASEDVDGLEATYLKAKNGASRMAENRAASAFFVRELSYRRRRHRETMRDAAFPSAEYFRSASRYAANLTMNLTCGYGERPRRVIGSSLALVGAFGLLYFAFGIAGDTLVENLIFSTESFVALVLGSPSLSKPYANLLTSTEAFLGAYFIALFVFTLTRSIRR